MKIQKQEVMKEIFNITLLVFVFYYFLIFQPSFSSAQETTAKENRTPQIWLE
jgi:hypothetical protein